MNDLFNDLDILKIYEWFNGLKSYAAVAYGLICACSMKTLSALDSVAPMASF